MNDPVITEHKIGIMAPQSGKPEDILDKRREFPGTAALVDRLLPYHQHAGKSMRAGTGDTALAQKFVPGTQQGDYSHFPQALGDAVIAHLTALQSSAFFFESQGNAKRADEIRDVAETLSGMLNLIQSIGQNGIPGVGKPATPHGGHRNGK